MEGEFIKQFKEFLKAQAISYIEHKVLTDTPFLNLYLPQLKLIFHLVDYKTLQQKEFPANLFQSLSVQFSYQKIQILHIWEDVWFSRNHLVKSKILNYFKLNKRIPGRSCNVQKTDKAVSDSFFMLNHLLGSTTNYYKMGLFQDQKLVAAITFSKSRIMVDGPNLYRSFELIRFANSMGNTVVGGLGKLLKHFITLHHCVHIMTYIDLDWGYGESFIKMGFVKVGYTEPNLFYIDPKKHLRTYYKKTDKTVNQLSDMVKGFNAGSAKLILDLRKF
ncbi:MAG: hypothetical protein H7296_06800 [Bacteroidia bacterium]|nr:hypothetical protein [Bacteroidia bacterium]